jgi:hypothetical protein
MKYLYKPFETVIENGYVYDFRMAFAMEILKSHPLITAVPDGEDSAGRQKLRSQESKEVVAKAVEISEALFEEAEKRGWIKDATTDDVRKRYFDMKLFQEDVMSDVFEYQRQRRLERLDAAQELEVE